jgi:hypothetical protein
MPDTNPPPTTKNEEAMPQRQKRSRGTQSVAVTEMRALQQIHAALSTLDSAEARTRILASACSMARIPWINPDRPQAAN